MGLSGPLIMLKQAAKQLSTADLKRLVEAKEKADRNAAAAAAAAPAAARRCRCRQGGCDYFFFPRVWPMSH